MLTLKIAWRNIFRQKRRTVLTVLSMFGGFTLSAVSIGFADGTYNRIINAFTRNRLGHIQIHREGYRDRPSLFKTIPSYQKIGDKLAEIPGVEAWAPRLYGAGLASLDERTAGASIIGIDPAAESYATGFEKKLIEGRTLGRTPARQAVLGSGLAKRLRADLGSLVVIVSQAGDGSIANEQYEVVGISESGDALSDLSSFYLHIRDAQELFVLEHSAHEIVIISHSLWAVDSLTQRINSLLDDPNLETAPWQDFARAFYVAMQADKRGSWVTLIIIIIIVAIGVLNTVLMTVLERTREYGVLRAIGTRPALMFRLVVAEMTIMSILGIALGSVVVLGVNHYLSQQGIAMPEPFTYGGMEFSHFYSELNAHSFYIPALTVILSAILVSALPALRAARIRPAQALRMH